MYIKDRIKWVHWGNFHKLHEGGIGMDPRPQRMNPHLWGDGSYLCITVSYCQQDSHALQLKLGLSFTIQLATVLFEIYFKQCRTDPTFWDLDKCFENRFHFLGSAKIYWEQIPLSGTCIDLLRTNPTFWDLHRFIKNKSHFLGSA